MATPVLIKDLISLPERVQPGDFVLRLSEGVSDVAASATLRDYVVTPELQRNFDQALGAIDSALTSGSSKAGYLHGSFGSGKSHFMAVLFLLLRGNLEARSLPELAPLVGKYDGWLTKKKLLTVPFHMIGARSVEQGVFGQYVEYVKRLHPKAPLPGIFLSAPIFENAATLRRSMGDERFFSALNEGKGNGEWGEFAESWNPTSLEDAMSSSPDSEPHVRLVGDLVTTLLPAYQDLASAGAGFVEFDRGLAALSQHAKALGYDGLVLFLDELILWLASHAADPEFIAREAQKVVKLAEAADANRPVPIVSFVARQRDLRELVGQQFTGSEELAFQDILRYWEDRFFLVTLEDRNLPAIISRRILAPVSEAARQRLDAAFNEAAADPTLVRALLTRDSDLGMFRQVYPFSPALVQALVAVSSLLQRERTAIKVLLQILVEQRDSLALGDIVPVGDLFDTVAQGSNAFSEAMRRHFDQARRLYEMKLQPLIEEQHGVTFADVAAGQADAAAARALRADDRLVKTLLLAALVPEVESLKSLTPGRLSALNHGTIRTPIRGAEKNVVAKRVRDWAARVGEVRVTDEGDNPTVAIQLAGVDVESILEKARGEDNSGNRRRKVRELLFKQLGITDAEGLFQTHEFNWRGTRRRAEVVYGNVRELSDETFETRGDLWRVLIDFPFDPEPNYGPADDLARVGQYRQTGNSPRTVVWIPGFLSHSAQTELGDLVILDHVLMGERFATYASHLSPVDQQVARGLLENRQAQLRQRLRAILEGAYGVATPVPGTIVHELEPNQQFQSLFPACRLRPPTGANLHEALDHLLRQTLDVQYPKHPEFGDNADVRTATLKRVWTEVQAALQLENWRKVVDSAYRKTVRQIVFPLELCDVGDDVIVVKRTWQQHFDRYVAQEGGALTVARLRGWMDQPEARGLLPEMQNLVILTYAEMTNRRFTIHGGPASPSVEQIDDRCELVEEPLPSAEDWALARSRAADIFGLDLPPLRNASTVGAAAEEVVQRARQLLPQVQALSARLPETLRQFGVDLKTAPRARTTAGVCALFAQMDRTEHRDVIPTFARAAIVTTGPAYGAAAKRAGEVSAALEQVNWEPIEALGRLGDNRQDAAEALLKQLREGLELEELAVALAGRLRDVERKAVALLIPPQRPKAKPAGWKTLASGSAERVPLSEARQKFEQAIDAVKGESDVCVTLSWTVEKKVGQS